VAWIGSVVLAVIVVTVVLLAITANRADDFWRLAVPTYLTGVGTLALAVLNVMLRGQEAADRKALTDAQGQRDREDALREARKIIPIAAEAQSGLIEVLNAGTEPIVDVHLISGGSSEDTPPNQVWSWEHGNGFGASYRAVLLPGDQLAFGGRWVSRWGWPESQDLTLVEMPSPPPNADRGWLQAAIAWTDSRGLHWRRTGANPPERLAKSWTWGN
jgi:hypothetical protein